MAREVDTGEFLYMAVKGKTRTSVVRPNQN